MSDMAQTASATSTGYIVANEPMYSADQMVKHLETRQKSLESSIADLGRQMTSLADKQRELTRVNAALTALNGHAEAEAPPEMFLCGYCPRDFTTRRGLARHEHAAHPGASGSQSLLDGS